MSLMKNDTSWTSVQTHPSMFSNSPKLYLATSVQTFIYQYSWKWSCAPWVVKCSNGKFHISNSALTAPCFLGISHCHIRKKRPALEEKTLSIWAIFRFAKILRRQPPWVEVPQEMAPRMMCFCGPIWIQRFSSSTRIEPAAASFFLRLSGLFRSSGSPKCSASMKRSRKSRGSLGSNTACESFNAKRNC